MEAAGTFKCANCDSGVLTDLYTCESCHNAPVYQHGELADVYCNATCRQEHLEAHKSQCELRVKRAKVLRTAALMKATFMTFRECLYGRPLVAIRVHNGELHLHLKPEAPFIPWYCPFPESITTNKEHKEAAISIQNCNASAGICGALANRLLEGIASKMELFTLDVKPRMLARYITPSRDPDRPALNYPLHSVVVIYLEEEKWIIDMTGGQFGFTDLVSPFDKYLEDWEGHVKSEPIPYPVGEMDDIERNNLFPSISDLRSYPEFVAHHAHEEAGRNHLKELITKRFFDKETPNFGADFLERPQEAFQEGVKEWEVEVRKHMMEFVRRMTGKFHPNQDG